jgi:hypothetical protein
VSHRRPARRSTGVLAAVAVVAVLAGGAVAWAVTRPVAGHGSAAPRADRAGTTLPPPASTSGTVGSPSRTTTRSATSAGPHAEPTPTTKPPCGQPGDCGFPSALTTGFGSTSLRVHTGDMEIHQNGMVISGWDLHGALDIWANDVTIEDSRITSSTWWGVNLRTGYTGLKVLHCQITAVPGQGPDAGGEDYAVSNGGDGTLEVGWNDISVFGDALSTGNGFLHDNYVHDIVPFVNQSGTYEHTDAVISDGSDPAGLTIQHNTLLNPVGATKGASAAVGLFADDGPVTNTTVDDNWIGGGAYALYGGGTGSTDVRITGNVFSTEYWPAGGIYGPATAWDPQGAGNTWQDNAFADGKPIAAPPSQ